MLYPLGYHDDWLAGVGLLWLAGVGLLRYEASRGAGANFERTALGDRPRVALQQAPWRL